MRPKREYSNPIKAGFQFAQYLKEHPGATYDDTAEAFGISKARVCQMLALCNRLPAQITDYLLNTDEPQVLKYFTERRLRPLTLMEKDDEKIYRFNEMREGLEIGSTV